MMKKVIKAVIMTILAIPLIYLFIVDPFEQKADFALSDFYIRSVRRMRQTKCSEDIVILSVDDLSRHEIAEVAEIADYLGARKVGLDVFMNGRTEWDSDVLAALSSCERLVLPSSLTEDFSESLFKQIPESEMGYVNLECLTEGGIIRSYASWRSTVPSFAAALCDYDKDEKGIIRYDGVDFDILKPEELSSGRVAGKIVIIGNINDFSDCHPTPIGTISGVMIHAFIAQTILDQSAPTPWGKGVLFLIAFLIGLVLLICHSSIAEVNSDLANLTVRIGQLILLILLYLCGVALFAYCRIYVDFSLPILMVAAVLLLFDIVQGVKAVWELSKGRS